VKVNPLRDTRAAVKMEVNLIWWEMSAKISHACITLSHCTRMFHGLIVVIIAWTIIFLASICLLDEGSHPCSILGN
jgi:hypothetical protein